MKRPITIFAAACFASAVFAQQTNQPPKPSPEHQKLALWFGEWTYEGENQTTFLGPGGKFTGRMTGRPILDGFGAEYVFVENGPSGETRTVEIDGYDSVAKNYPGIWLCSDGSLGLSSFTMNGNVATWEGTSMANGRRFKDRGTDAVAADGMSIVKQGEISEDGKTWVQVSTMKATKVKAAPADAASVKHELIGLEEAWAKALLTVDVTFLETILAEDYASTDDEGVVSTRAKELANLRSGDFKCAALKTENYTVRLYGDTAIVTGRNTQSAQFKGKDVSGKFQWTDTWVKRGGRWLCVAGHGSKVLPQ